MSLYDICSASIACTDKTVVNPVSEILSAKGRYRRHWEVLAADNEFVGAQSYARKLETYLLELVGKRNLTEEEAVSVTSSTWTSNYAMILGKHRPSAFRALGSKNPPESYITFPEWDDPKWAAFKSSLSEGVDPIDHLEGGRT